ncbi:MAG TPA: hypothetical protein VHF58_07295 [Solirubrobacterales bacterium]|nr:hypothetical protein [Solirubrobacterales bacterium]
MTLKTQSIAQRLLSAVDLAIDFATLGEYGLEPLPADGPCRERARHSTAREALTAARSRGCDAGARRRERPRVRELV